MTKRPPQPDLHLGPLPVEIINRTIGTELEPGEVILTRAAQRHAATRHPTDYPLLQPFLAAIVGNPLYVGDDHRNPGKLELIGYVRAARTMALVAVTMQKDQSGHYRVASFYAVKHESVQRRREKGFLKPAKSK